MLEKWREVKNNPGFGSFHARIIKGSAVNEYFVSAVDFGQFLEFEEKYIESKLLEGNPLVVYRTGNRGACVVITNPTLLEVSELKRYYTEPSALYGEIEHEVHEDPTKRQFLGGRGERIEVSATLAGLPFSATISFVPSPK